MTPEEKPDDIQIAADYLLDRFEPHVAALMAYGSRVFGRPRRGSAYDFWLIVDDPVAFHHDNAEFYRTELNVPSTPAQQLALNRDGPNFYALKEDGHDIKIAVLGEEDFVRFCHDSWWTVKGRMQKPLRIIRCSPAVSEAIRATRKEALACALNLVPREFTIRQLLWEVVGLSYRAEVRPENKSAKIQSIVDAGQSELERIYVPLLAEHAGVERCGERYVDPRDPEERRQGRKATLRALRKSKWSRHSFKYIWRNYRTHRAPLRYIVEKTLGEIEKTFTRLFKSARKQT